MNVTISDEQAMAAAALIKEYAAAQRGCQGCAFTLEGSARCIISPSGCAGAWNLPSAKPKESETGAGFLNPGDVCTYSFGEKNRSNAVVEVVRILDDPRGAAEIKFLDVIVDDTGNGYFNFLLRTGYTMNASLQYLQKREA